MFHKSRELAKQANMSYTHITLDVGAAIKAYHVIWNNPQAWAVIIIHLENFDAIMAFFGVFSCFVSESGFEDILFQAGLYSSGSIAGLLSDKHYNRNLLLEAFSEALERLFEEQYIPEVPEMLLRIAESPPGTVDVDDLPSDATVKPYMEH